MIDYVIIEARREPNDRIILTKRIARNQRLSVGRTDAADLIVGDDPEMSGKHFELAVEDEQCVVVDQNSRNKTWLNEREISRSSVDSGDTIRAGRTLFRFQLVRQNSGSFPGASGKYSFPAAERQAKPGHVNEPERRFADTNTGSTSAPPLPPVPKYPPPAPPPVVPRTVDVPDNLNPVESGFIDWGRFVDTGSPPRGAGSAPSPSTDEAPAPARPAADEAMGRPQFDDKRTCDGEINIDGTTRIEGNAIRDFEKITIRTTGDWCPPAEMSLLKSPPSKIVVGRHPNVDWSCPNDMVMSERHFEIEIAGNRCLVRDLESTNGTLLNGHEVHVAPVTHGDKIRAGQSEFVIEFIQRAT